MVQNSEEAIVKPISSSLPRLPSSLGDDKRLAAASLYSSM